MNRFFVAAGSTILFLSTKVAAFAQEDELDPCGDAPNEILAAACAGSEKTVGEIIGFIVTIAFIIAILVALLFLIWGGIKWITSSGDKAGVEAARNQIVAAVIGLVIVFLAFFILNLVLGLFGLNIFTLDLPTFVE